MVWWYSWSNTNPRSEQDRPGSWSDRSKIIRGIRSDREIVSWREITDPIIDRIVSGMGPRNPKSLTPFLWSLPDGWYSNKSWRSSTPLASSHHYLFSPKYIFVKRGYIAWDGTKHCLNNYVLNVWASLFSFKWKISCLKDVWNQLMQ